MTNGGDDWNEENFHPHWNYGDTSHGNTSNYPQIDTPDPGCATLNSQPLLARGGVGVGRLRRGKGRVGG